MFKVGVNANNCELVLESAKPLNKKAILNSKFPWAFEGLDQPNGNQLKVHQDDAIAPVSQPLHCSPFRIRQKVTNKLELLEELDVIEKVSSLTSSVVCTIALIFVLPTLTPSRNVNEIQTV